MKKQITWDDLAGIPAEDFEEGRVAVTGLEGGEVTVTSAYVEYYRPRLTTTPGDAPIYKSTLDALGLGLVREVEEHPHGLIPEEPWTHIVLGDGRHAVRSAEGAANGFNWSIQEGEFSPRATQSYIQALADEHGFEVLTPESRVEEAREEGRLAGIREVYEKYGPLRVIDGAGRLSYYLEHAYSAEMFEEGDR